MCGQVKVVVKIESEDDMLVLQVKPLHFLFMECICFSFYDYTITKNRNINAALFC